jgi:hypothetical protein
MDEWKTLKQIEMDAGANNFLEVTLKQPPGSDEELVGISKGWKTAEGEKRYKSNILFSKEKKEELVKALQEITQ